MSIILDILVGAALIIGISVNARRGLVKSLLIVVGYIFAMWLSAFLSANYSEDVYKGIIEDKLTDKLSTQTQKLDSAEMIRNKVFIKKLGIDVSVEEVRTAILDDGDLVENLTSLALSKKSGVDKNLVKKAVKKDIIFKDTDAKIVQIAINNKDLIKAVRILADDDKENRSEIFYREIGYTYMLTVTKWIMTLLLYIVISSILGIIINNIHIIDKIPIARTVNTILGGVVGAAEGVIIIMISALLIKVVTVLFAISDSAVNDTTFFKIFYDIFK